MWCIDVHRLPTLCHNIEDFGLRCQPCVVLTPRWYHASACRHFDQRPLHPRLAQCGPTCFQRKLAETGLSARVETRVEKDWHTGLAVERGDQVVEERAGVPRHALQASGTISVAHAEWGARAATTAYAPPYGDTA